MTEKSNSPPKYSEEMLSFFPSWLQWVHILEVSEVNGKASIFRFECSVHADHLGDTVSL